MEASGICQKASPGKKVGLLDWPRRLFTGSSGDAAQGAHDTPFVILRQKMGFGKDKQLATPMTTDLDRAIDNDIAELGSSIFPALGTLEGSQGRQMRFISRNK